MSKDFKATLPKNPGKLVEDINQFSFMIHGEPGIGKTTFASQFPDVFFMFFERGGRRVNARKLYIPDWSDALKQLKLMEANPGYCKLVVIDTGYRAYEKCFYWSMDDMGLEKPGDEEWGNAWKFIDRNFQEFHIRLEEAGYSYMVIAHSEETVRKLRGGGEIHKIKTMLGKQASRYYNADADLIGYYELDPDGNHVMHIKDNPDVEVKNRIDGKFLYNDTGKQIKTLPMGNSFEEAFRNFSAGFENRLTSKGGIVNDGSLIKTPEKRVQKKLRLKFK